MAVRGFNRALTEQGSWLKRLAIKSDKGAAPVLPPVHIFPSAAPTGTAEEGDIYLDTNGVLQVHNGTNWVPGGGGNVVVNYTIAAAADHITSNIFVADRAYQLVSVEAAHVTASTSGTLQITKCTGTQDPGSGVNMLTSTISTAGTANTVVSGTLSATAANTALADGDRIALVTGGTATNIVGAVVTIVLRPV